MAEKLTHFLPLILSLIILAVVVRGQPVTGSVSDGVSEAHQPPFLLLNGLVPSETCEEPYGFMPCSNTIVGNIFLLLVYGYLIFSAARYLSDGSEVLLEILGPGIVGGLILPLLSSLPDAVIVLASGLSGSKKTAQVEVSVGMGLLAGSTVMVLTVVWGSCVLVGKCDLVNSVAQDSQDTKGLSLTGSGVSTDIWTCYTARLMVVSVVPFIIVQLPLLFWTNFQNRIAILISFFLSICLLLSYCLYQVFQPWIQRRRLAYAKHKHVIARVLKHLKMRALGRLFSEDGKPNTEVIEKLFNTIDENCDGYLSALELRALIIGIEFEDINLDHHDAVDKVMKEFDTSRDSQVDMNEFINGISKWLSEMKSSANFHEDHRKEMKLISDFHMQTKREHDLLGDLDDEVAEKIENPMYNALKAVLMLLLGTAIAAAIAHPFVDAISNFSSATSIPSFFVAFIILPFIRSSEGLAVIIFACRKKQRTASLTFSQVCFFR
ncbi:unnamed protein product [Ilex paraguariensis]|uniref:EF-hand domain-containing protein n=1 Tax=Ilex paraguariensis TaxID=185542 RepID=A0ABC8U8X9_9AQUA